MKLVLLAEVKGESSVAADYYVNGVNLAVEEINAAGGIGGQPIELQRFAASPLDPQATNAAVLSGLDENPSAMIGLVAGGSQVQASAANIERGEVPVLVTAPPDLDSRYGGKGGSEFAWFMSPYTLDVAEAGTRFLIEELKLAEIGLMGTNETYGATSLAGSKIALDAAGQTPVAERTYPPTATDLTEQVLAMKDADGVVNWGYPNPVAVQLTQFEQNGLRIPTLTGATGEVVVNSGMAKGAAISQLYGIFPCNPTGSDEPKLQAFAQAYQARFGTEANSLTAIAYDAVYTIKAAIEHAGSADPGAINKALGEVTVEAGVVCASRYRADGSHAMAHETSVSSYREDGSSTVVKVYELPDLAKAG